LNPIAPEERQILGGGVNRRSPAATRIESSEGATEERYCYRSFRVLMSREIPQGVKTIAEKIPWVKKAIAEKERKNAKNMTMLSLSLKQTHIARN
jgi:hypothetical protein